MFKSFSNLFKEEVVPVMKRDIITFEDNRKFAPIGVWMDDDIVGYLNYHVCCDSKKGYWYFKQSISSIVNLRRQDLHYIAGKLDELNIEES